MDKFIKDSEAASIVGLKCIALLATLTPTEQMAVVEHLAAKIAIGMNQRHLAHQVLDGIRKHAGQLVDSFLPHGNA
jgi:hypothetical protein